MPDFRSIRAAHTPPPSLCPSSRTLPQPRLPTPLSTPAHNSPVLLSRSPRPTRSRSGARCGLPAARRLALPPAYPPFIRTGASHLHDAAALRSERFWSAEKTNAGESKLRSHSQAWPRRGSSLGPGHKEERLPQLFPVTSESAHSAPSVKPVHSTAEFTLTCPPAQITEASYCVGRS